MDLDSWRAYQADKLPLSTNWIPPKYERGKDEVVEAITVTGNRTDEPECDIVIGEERYRYPEGPFAMIQAPEIPGQPNPARAAWNGWRPKYPELPETITMPIPERGRKFETKIPSESELRISALNIGPYPIVEPGQEFSEPETWKGYGMGNLGTYLSIEDLSRARSGLGDFGQAAGDAVGGAVGAGTATPQPSPLWALISNIASGVASVVKAKYDSKAAQYAKTSAAQAGISYTAGGLPIAPPSAVSNIPWGTLAMVAGLGLGAFFIIPKLIGGRKKSRR